MTLATAGHVTRPVLGLDNLQIVDGTYDVFYDDGNGLDVGQTTWRRTTVESQWVPGRVVTGMVKDTAIRTLRVDVKGSSAADVQDKIKTLLRAVWQPHYHLSLTLDTGATYTWLCEPADTNVGFTYQHLLGSIAPVVMVIPTSPIPASGPI